jgi:2-methylcitrate dehydratase
VKQLDYPKGDPRNPLTDGEIEAKFRALAAPVLNPARQQRVIDAVWDLENLSIVTELMELLKADAAIA